MADGGFVHGGTVTRWIDGARWVFQRLDGLWMIDRLGDTGRDDDPDADDTNDPVHTDDRATAIARVEVQGLDEEERQSFLARQRHKLGLLPGSVGAATLWRVITDFDRFDPWMI